MTRSFGAAQGVILLGLAVAACSDGGTPATAPSSPEIATPPVQMARSGPRRHVIVLKDGSSADLQAAVQLLGGTVRRNQRQIGTLTVENLSDAAVATLRGRAEVQGIDADMTVQWIRPLTASNARVVTRSHIDQSGAQAFFLQWNLRVIEADKAWLVSREGQGTTVCVLDSGIDPNHIELQGRVDLTRTVSFVADEAATSDFAGHGTFVSAMINANGIVMASVAPKVNLCMVKVLDKTGSGSFADVIDGIVYATDAGADVINMSLGAYFSRKEDGAKELIRALQRAVDYASRKGVVVVAAAGNEGQNLNRDGSFISVPAELNHVISVGATAPTAQMNFDNIASYSNFGAKGVDVFAPGGDFVEGGQVEDLVLSACSSSILDFDCASGDQYLFGAGTSFAAPEVSGQAAILESQFPGDQSDELITLCIQRTAENPNGKRRDRLYDFGRINILKSLTCGFGS